jgi:hypothetical protein
MSTRPKVRARLGMGWLPGRITVEVQAVIRPLVLSRKREGA